MREIEEWKDIKGFERLYQVSNLGNVKSLKFGKERILKPCKNKKGYLCVWLFKNGKGKIGRVNRLVANAFLPNPNNLPEVNHIDEDKNNNRVDNLEWMSTKNNVRYSQAKSVNQYTLDGRFIRTWDCINELFYQFGYNVSHIIECCKGKLKTSYGFLWKYAD